MEAFQEDASRQEKFRASLLREKAVEREHRKQVLIRRTHSSCVPMALRQHQTRGVDVGAVADCMRTTHSAFFAHPIDLTAVGIRVLRKHQDLH